MFLPIIAAVAALLQLQDTRLQWVPNPRVTPGNWVADPASHLRPATRAAIDSTISELERESSAEIAVVIVDSLDGLEPGAAALLLHRRWGVGKRERDNGIVFLWSPRLRRTHVSVGYGLEGVLIDSRVGRIQDEQVIPAFRRDDFDAGMLAGVRALAAAAREETYNGLPRVTAGRPGPQSGPLSEPPSDSRWAWFIPGGLLAGFGLLFLAGLVRRHYPRRCPQGHGRMRRLSEIDDNAYLEAGAVLEEQVGSMDYDVWTCEQCHEWKLVPYKRFSFSYRQCPQCKRRTCASKAKLIRAATYASTGLREVTRTCRNCGFSDTRQDVLPVLTRSSSGSGSGSSFSGGGGGSSFGGGSSGGGGAGRSY